MVKLIKDKYSQPKIRDLLVNQGEATYFNYDIFEFNCTCCLVHKSKQPPSPICYYFPTICYEHLVYHCSLGNDHGSLPRYCIFNVYLIRVRPRSSGYEEMVSSGPVIKRRT